MTPDTRLKDEAGTDAQLERGLTQLRKSANVLYREVYGSFLAFDWFVTLDGASRAWIDQVLRRQIEIFLDQLGKRETRAPQLSFLTHPPQATANITPEQATELLRRACQVLVRMCTTLVDPPYADAVRAEADGFLREVAFAVAAIYARVAEKRAATQVRRFAGLVQALADGEPADVVSSRAVGLLPDEGPLRAVALVPRGAAETVLADVLWCARHRSLPLVAAVRGEAIVALIPDAVERFLDVLPPRSARVLVVGPAVSGVTQLATSVQEALSGLAVAPAHGRGSRVLQSADMLPERALGGDVEAKAALVRLCLAPLIDAGGGLLGTVEAVLDADGVMESVARALPAHVNTVRYRLSRIQSLTGRDPRRSRDALEFQIALMHHRMQLAEHGEPAVSGSAARPR